MFIEVPNPLPAACYIRSHRPGSTLWMPYLLNWRKASALYADAAVAAWTCKAPTFPKQVTSSFPRSNNLGKRLQNPIPLMTMLSTAAVSAKVTTISQEHAFKKCYDHTLRDLSVRTKESIHHRDQADVRIRLEILRRFGYAHNDVTLTNIAVDEGARSMFTDFKSCPRYVFMPR